MDAMLIQALEGFMTLLRQLFINLLGNDAEIWGNELKKFLRREPCWVKVEEKMKEVVKKVLTPFIIIRTGGTTADKLIADIKANKNENDVADEVSDYASSMMANQDFTVSGEMGTVDLVTLSIAELGFTENPLTADFMIAEFCAKWSAKNLDGYVIELCQPEDGPQLRKQWLDQPKGTVVWMAMERITDSDRFPSVFHVGRYSDGCRWLGGCWAGPEFRWNLASRIVFRLRKIT